MNELLNKLNQSILSVLNECDSVDTPNIYVIKSTEGGLKSVLKLIRERVIKQKMGIYEAITSIENEFREI